MIDVAPTSQIINVGPPYIPPPVTVMLLPTTSWITDANYRAQYIDNVQLSTPARVYLSARTGPGPDVTEALTQLGIGPVFAFIPGDYAGGVLIGQDMEDAYFYGADMQGVNFSNANLQGTQFINTPVQGAQFFQADLRGADLTGAIGLQPQQLYPAIYDTSTILPSWIDSSIFGPFATG